MLFLLRFFWGWPFLSSFDATFFASGEGVSGPVVRPTDETPCTLLHERLSTDSARLRTMQRHWDDLKSIAQQELTLSIFHTVRSLIRLVFITSHLVYYSTMTSLDL